MQADYIESLQKETRYAYTVVNARLNNASATVYLTTAIEKSNGIVREDTDTGILFQISAYLEIEELIELANGILKK